MRMNGRLDEIAQLFEFIKETDKLKSVYRQTLITDRSRQENSAEHSWHLALMAVLFKNYANDPNLDVLRVIQMVLVHDIVEIDAGDTLAYDTVGHADKEERETAAARRIFGMLAEAFSAQFMQLWREFEDRETAEAKFAAALDNIHPMVLNYATEGAAWKKHGIKREQVLARNRSIANGSKDIWAYAEQLIDAAVRDGYLGK